jgi:tetratricopeptide (TPR) repeat protein
MSRLFAAILFLLLPLCSFAQKSATIAGNVYYGSEYNAAKNVTVSLYDSQHQLIESQATTDAGQFRFGGLRRAQYSINIDAPGYEPFSTDVDVSMASDKGVTIYLKSTSKPNENLHSPTVSVHELTMPAKARDFMESGKKKLYEDKNAQAAVADFQQAVGAAPEFYEADYQLAMAQLTLGNRAEAESSFRKSVDLSNGKFPESQIGLGAVLLDTGKISEADQSIRAGLKLNPTLWLGHYELGRLLLKQNRLSEAQSSAEEARLLAPAAPIVYRLLSNIHLQQKNYPALLEDLDTYLTLDPDSPAGQRAKQLRDQLQQEPTPTSTQP